MQTVENQLQMLMTFVGPGVLNGWEVTKGVPMDERVALASATPTSNYTLYTQYLQMEQPDVNDEVAWAQVVRVSTGGGIVGVFRAQTVEVAYIRLTEYDKVFYVWAEAGLCLTTQGLVQITIPLDGYYYNNLRTTATYLATVTTIQTSTNSGISEIYKITYDERRQDLFDLAGALKTALESAFYHHVHLGGINHPSKILLSTNLILQASSTVTSTIFYVTNNGAIFTWNPANYGIPVVTLNNIVIPPSDYVLTPSSGKLELQNSIIPGQLLQVILPLSPQTKLTIHSPSQITDNLQDVLNPVPIYLTDGVLGSDGNPRIYTWDPNVTRAADVYLKGTLITTGYTTLPSQGAINFDPALNGSSYQNGDLIVIITKIGDQIQSKLAGSRVTDVDASTFTKGTLDPSRMAGLDHVGSVRFMESATVRPSLRLFSYGDGLTYYAEDAGQALQFGSKVFTIAPTQNISPNFVIGTSRGLMLTRNTSSTQLSSGWLQDNGQPSRFWDDVLQDTPNTNHFNTTYTLALGAQNVSSSIYYTTNGGNSWLLLRKPIVNNIAIDPTAFWVSTDRVESSKSLFLTTYDYSSIRYYGTASGVFSTTVPDGATNDGWAWGFLSAYGSVYVNDLVEICTVNSTTVSDDSGNSATTLTYDRTLYVGNANGLYVGGKQITFLTSGSIAVKGLFWIRSGGAQNGLMWFTDNDVYLSATAQYVTTTTSTSSNSYWVHPLSNVPTNSYPNVRLATVANLDSFVVSSIDGVALATSDRVLVRAQTSSPSNGIYVYNGSSLVRATDDMSIGNQSVSVLEGNTLAGSCWALGSYTGTFALGVTPIVWTNLWYRIAHITNAQFKNACQTPSTDSFVVWSQNGSNELWNVGLTFTNTIINTPTISTTGWTPNVNGTPHTACYFTDGGGTFLTVGSDRGIWRSSDSATTFQRNRQVFSIYALLQIYNAISQNIIDPLTYTVAQSAQGIVFSQAQEPWTNLVYEKDFTTYYLANGPWISTNADVVVYINNQPSLIPYTLNSTLGTITFTNSLNPKDTVQATITRDGAYISNVGLTPHEELPNATVISAPLTTLSNSFLPGATSISVVNFNAIPLDATILEISYNTNIERVSVIVDAPTQTISLSSPRTGTFTFPASSNVSNVTMQRILGIEDELSLATSNETYHLNSLFGDNVIQLSLAADNGSLYNNYATNPAPGFASEADRGPKQALYVDLSNSSAFDAKASGSGITESLIPQIGDTATNPNAVYALKNVTQDGEGMLVGTDEGIWTLSGGNWIQQSDLNQATNVYYFDTSYAGETIAGTELGLYIKQTDNSWVNDPLYPQANFAHISGSFYGGNLEAYGKKDGLSGVWTQTGQPFQSDHFDPLDGENVYGLWLGQFFRVTGDPPVQNSFDALYVCSEVGLYGLTNQGRPGVYSGFFAGREMFGANRQLIDGQPVKYYKIFQAPPTPTCDGSTPKPTVPIIILSNNGVYRVRNWRWCDPNDASSLDFYPEVHALAGISCTCYATTTTSCAPNVEPLSKCFIGTSSGVYRSYDQGGSWQRCERLGGNNIPVYTLAFAGTCLVAGTSEGFYASSDDGDTWYRTGDTNSCASFDYRIGATQKFSSQYLAMTFRPPDNATHINKIGAYLETQIPLDATDPSAFSGSYLLPSIWTVDGSGNLLTQVTNNSAPQHITFDQVLYPGFWHATVDVTLPLTNSGPSDNILYALVLQENYGMGTNNESAFRWFGSHRVNPYPYGEGFVGSGGGPSWSRIPGPGGQSLDLFFQIYLNLPSTAVDTDVLLNFDIPDASRGCIVNDYGFLSTDFKLAAAIVVDDSQSQAWSDPVPGSKQTHLPDIINTLWARTLPSNAPVGFYPSFGDIYTFGVDVIDQTSGYTNNLNSLDITLANLFNQGTSSDLYTACSQAFSTLEPQAIIDAVGTLSPTDQQSLVANIVAYMNAPDRKFLRLYDLKVWFISQPEAEQSAWPVSNDGFGNPVNDVGYTDDDLIALISQFSDVSGKVVSNFAQTYTPFAIVVADGDNNGLSSPSDAATTAQSAWLSTGVQVFCLGTGKDHDQTGLRTLANLTGGLHVDIANGNSNGDWDAFKNSLIQYGSNSLFTAYWQKAFDFEEPTFVTNTSTVFYENGGTCVIKVRWTSDRINWSEWTTMQSGVSIPLNFKIYCIQYTVELTDGWNLGNNSPLKPVVESIRYTSVTPGIEYYITNTYPISGMLFEYLLSSTGSLPPTTELTWGIVRGDDVDFNNFEPILQGRKGCLVNRQRSIQFTEPIVRNCTTTTTDHTNYTVVINGVPVTWTSTDTVQVYISGVLINPAVYSLNASKSLVIFQAQQPPGAVVTVVITTPAFLYNYYGEPTTTFDQKTYIATNGGWPYDATVIVFLNGNIIRGGFWMNSQNGTVTFFQELLSTDVVTIYIQFAQVFRIGAMLKKYSSDSITMNKVGLYYTDLPNTSVLFDFLNPPPPSVVVGSLAITPSSPTIYQRMQVDYTFYSPENSTERGSNIQWWRWRYNDPNQGTYTDVDIDGYAHLTAVNGFTGNQDYKNRTVERSADIGNPSGLFKQGDKIYVVVKPSDGFSTGQAVNSKPAITLRGTHVPYVYGLLIQAPGTTVVNNVVYVPAGTSLTAFYYFNSIDGGSDFSSVVWYNRDGQTPFYTGKTVPASLVKSGLTLNFEVVPFDGQTYGNPQISGYITVQ
jgi:hypothetical protein